MTEVGAVPSQKTLALANLYIVHTTKLLNGVAAVTEEQLQRVEARLAGLETQLMLLEGRVSANANAAQAEPGSGIADPFELEPALLSTGSQMQSKPSNIELPVSAAPSAAGDSEHLEEIDPEPGGTMARE